MTITRRELLRLVGATGVALGSAPACSSTATANGLFSAAERNALGALANAVFPPDHEPGGQALGAVEYIERLVTAFDFHLPTVFAGGPFSGRQPFPDAQGHASSNFPANDFAQSIELDRVSEFVWKLRLLGSNGVPGGAPNEAILGPVIGLRRQIKDGLASAMSANPTLASLNPDDLASAFNSLDVVFRDLMIDLVTEAAFSAPEYGGNKGLAGWQICHFEGDSQPLGFSQYNGKTYVERTDAPLSTANPGPDPAPMDAATKQTLDAAVAFLGGRVNG